MPSDSLLGLELVNWLNRFRKSNLVRLLDRASCLLSKPGAGDLEAPFELPDNRVASFAE
jgi:hypothetical protein